MIHEEARGQTEEEDDSVRRMCANRTTRCPLGEERRGGKGPSWGGRRSNEPTSHGVVPTRAPSCFFLLLRRCLPRALLALLALLSFFLHGVVILLSLSFFPHKPLSFSLAAVLLALILFIFPRSCSSTMWFDDLRSLRSFLRLLPYSRARNRPRYLAKLFDGKLHRRPADSLFRNKLRRYHEIFSPVYSRSASTSGLRQS